MPATPSPRKRLRRILCGSSCVSAAPVYDSLSARLAETTGWELCKLTGSSGKAAGFALPDEVRVTNVSDVVETCRGITRVADISLIVDADHGGDTVVNVRRTVRDLEAVGAAAIEIEDLVPASTFEEAEASGVRFAPREEQVAKLEAAVASRLDPSTVIVARTRALELLPAEEAMARIRDYARTGVDLLYLPGVLPRGRADIEAAHEATRLPLALLHIPPEVEADAAFLDRNQVRVRTMQQLLYGVAVQAMYDGLKHLKDGGEIEDLKDRRATAQILSLITGADEFRDWEERFVRE